MQAPDAGCSTWVKAQSMDISIALRLLHAGISAAQGHDMGLDGLYSAFLRYAACPMPWHSFLRKPSTHAGVCYIGLSARSW